MVVAKSRYAGRCIAVATASPWFLSRATVAQVVTPFLVQ